MSPIDKRARLAAEAAAAAEKARAKAAALNPPFPYKVLPFRPAFFG